MSLHKLSSGILYHLFYLLCPPCLLSLILWLSIKTRKEIKNKLSLTFLLTLISAQVSYILYSGGDHMPGFRFYLPIIPSIILALYHLLDMVNNEWNKNIRVLFAGIICVFITMEFVFFSIFKIRVDPAAYQGKITGQYIQQHFPKGSLIALNTAGSTPYFALDHQFIDMLGLNDAHIAKRKVEINHDLVFQSRPGHHKGDGEYVLSRQPDYVILGTANGESADKQQWFLSDYELSLMPEFYQQYEKKTATIDVSSIDGHQFYPLSIKDGNYLLTYYQRIKN